MVAASGRASRSFCAGSSKRTCSAILRGVKRFVALFFALLVLVPAQGAFGQDDWGITRPGRPTRPTRPPRPHGGVRPPRPHGGTTQATPEQTPDRHSNVLIERYLRILEANPGEAFAFQRLLDLYRERDGNIDGFLHELEERARRDAASYPPRMMLGQLYRSQNRNADAERMYREALALRPSDPSPLSKLAAIVEEASHHDEAIALYERALANTSDDAGKQELVRALADISMNASDYDRARGYYARLVPAHGASVYLSTEFARALAARREFARAAAEYERVRQSMRGDNRVLAPLLRDLGRAYLDAGDMEHAITVLNEGLRAAGPSAGVRSEIYEILVDAYRRSDRLAEFIAHLAHEATGFEANELRGRIEDELGHDEEALAAYRRALAANPQHVDTRLRIVQLLTRSGRLNEVVDEYRSLIRSSPREPRFVVELAQLLMQTGHRDEAMRLAAETSRRYAREPQVHQALAELYARWNEDALATAEVAILARIDPSDPAHLVALGAQQLESGNTQAALQTWRRILDVDSDRARAHATLGGIYADHDYLREAVAEYRESLRLREGDLDTQRGFATVLERAGLDAEAVAAWTRVIEMSRDDRAVRREARQRIIAIWQRQRQLPNRVYAFEAAFRATPPDLEAGRFLAEAYMRMRPQPRPELAERVLSRLVELEPGDVESLLALERARTSRGDLAGAIDVLQRLVQADDRRAGQYLQRMAELALALYRDADAVAYAARAVERNPDDATAHQRLADLYRARQDMPHAIASYRRAIELNERSYGTYFELAEIYLAQGELTEADQLFRRVMRSSPDDDLVARAVRAAIQIHLGDSTLEALEQELLPLALANAQRPIFRRLAVELYQSLVAPLVLAARGEGSSAQEARTRLTRVGTRAIKPLLEALADNDPAQNRTAVDILGELGNARAAVPLIAAAEADGDIQFRLTALRAAGSLASADLIPRFFALSRGDETRLRETATWAIGRIGGRTAVAPLRDRLHEGEPGVRVFAALGLGAAKDDTSRAQLEEALSDPSEDVRVAAAWALGRIGDARSVPRLVALLRNGMRNPASAAAFALGRIGGNEATHALLELLFSSDPRARSNAAVALRLPAHHETARASVLVVPASVVAAHSYIGTVLDADMSIATTGSVALSPLRDALIALASAALEGPLEEVKAALDLLGSLSDGVGLGPLTADLSAWPEGARAAALTDLRAIGSALANSLVGVTHHGDAAVRTGAVRVLSRIHTEEAQAAIVAALTDSSTEVNRAALDALDAHRANDNAVTQVSRVVRTHSDWATRARAAAALGRMARPSAQDSLADVLLHDNYAFVREAAAQALRGATAASAISALREALLHDTEPRVQVAAVGALRAMNSPEAREALSAARAAALPGEVRAALSAD